MTTHELDQATAERFARIALGHVVRPYPNKPGHVLSGPGDARTPQDLHPVFYGSYDWHSCVHGYWMLARLLNRFPAMAASTDIIALFDTQFVSDKIAGECLYLEATTARGFERPYGWAWLLKLASELAVCRDKRWSEALRPLVDVIVRRFVEFLPLATYPVRVGTHFNTAFALRLAADYAEGAGDGALLTLLRDTALRWYGADEDCPAWGEPSGDDFLSSTLIEAECMRRLLAVEDFLNWFDRFLPDIAQSMPDILFQPVTVSDRSDGKIAHLDGLNLSRAWCWRSLAGALVADNRLQSQFETAAIRHLDAALPHVAGDYMGEHWLASFAVLALEA